MVTEKLIFNSALLAIVLTSSQVTVAAPECSSLFQQLRSSIINQNQMIRPTLIPVTQITGTEIANWSLDSFLIRGRFVPGETNFLSNGLVKTENGVTVHYENFHLPNGWETADFPRSAPDALALRVRDEEQVTLLQIPDLARNRQLQHQDFPLLLGSEAPSLLDVKSIQIGKYQYTIAYANGGELFIWKLDVATPEANWRLVAAFNPSLLGAPVHGNNQDLAVYAMANGDLQILSTPRPMIYQTTRPAAFTLPTATAIGVEWGIQKKSNTSFLAEHAQKTNLFASQLRVLSTPPASMIAFTPENLKAANPQAVHVYGDGNIFVTLRSGHIIYLKRQQTMNQPLSFVVSGYQPPGGTYVTYSGIFGRNMIQYFDFIDNGDGLRVFYNDNRLEVFSGNSLRKF